MIKIPSLSQVVFLLIVIGFLSWALYLMVLSKNSPRDHITPFELDSLVARQKTFLRNQKQIRQTGIKLNTNSIK